MGVWGVCVHCPNTGPAALKSGWVYTALICLLLLSQDKVLVLGQHINLRTVGQDVFFQTESLAMSILSWFWSSAVKAALTLWTRVVAWCGATTGMKERWDCAPVWHATTDL